MGRCRGKDKRGEGGVGEGRHLTYPSQRRSSTIYTCPSPTHIHALPSSPCPNPCPSPSPAPLPAPLPPPPTPPVEDPPPPSTTSLTPARSPHLPPPPPTTLFPRCVLQNLSFPYLNPSHILPVTPILFCNVISSKRRHPAFSAAQGRNLQRPTTRQQVLERTKSHNHLQPQAQCSKRTCHELENSDQSKFLTFLSILLRFICTSF